VLTPLRFIFVAAVVVGLAPNARVEIDHRQLQSTSGHSLCAVDYVPHSSTESELVRIELEWCEAAVHREAIRLGAIFADDMSWLEDVGFRTKDQVVHRYMVEIREHGWRLTNIRMQIIGNVGEVSSHMHVSKTVAGRFSESDRTSVDVFEKRDGHWQLIAES